MKHTAEYRNHAISHITETSAGDSSFSLTGPVFVHGHLDEERVY